jgi:hypothetical protein
MEELIEHAGRVRRLHDATCVYIDCNIRSVTIRPLYAVAVSLHGLANKTAIANLSEAEKWFVNSVGGGDTPKFTGLK